MSLLRMMAVPLPECRHLFSAAKPGAWSRMWPAKACVWQQWGACKAASSAVLLPAQSAPLQICCWQSALWWPCQI